MIQICNLDNIKMKYFKFGNGNKNMIIIPGISLKSVMESEEAIINQYHEFINDFNVYVFDRKEDMNPNYSIKDMALDTIKIIDKLNLNNLYLFGASQGGCICLYIAILRPDLVKKLNINSSSYRFSDESYNILNELIQKNKYELTDGFSKLIYSNEFYNNVKSIIKPFSESISDLDLERFIITVKALKGFNIDNLLNNVKCDTLIIGSKLDKIISYKDIEYMKNKINKCNIFLYDNYSHAVYDEANDIRKKIYEFYMN